MQKLIILIILISLVSCSAPSGQSDLLQVNFSNQPALRQNPISATKVVSKLNLSQTELDFYRRALDQELSKQGLLDSQTGLTLTMSIDQFQERTGGAWGSNQAAAVALRFNLSKSNTTPSIWNSSFVYEEKSTSENLLAHQNLPARLQGLKWHKAKDLTLAGIEMAAAKLKQSIQ